MLAVVTLHFLGALAGIMMIIGTIAPAFLGPGVYISTACYLVGVSYIAVSRDLKVIESTQRTPYSNTLVRHSQVSLPFVRTAR